VLAQVSRRKTCEKLNSGQAALGFQTCLHRCGTGGGPNPSARASAETSWFPNLPPPVRDRWGAKPVCSSFGRELLVSKPASTGAGPVGGQTRLLELRPRGLGFQTCLHRCGTGGGPGPSARASAESSWFPNLLPPVRDRSGAKPVCSSFGRESVRVRSTTSARRRSPQLRTLAGRASVVAVCGTIARSVRSRRVCAGVLNGVELRQCPALASDSSGRGCLASMGGTRM
jgi:hypothetical protein